MTKRLFHCWGLPAVLLTFALMLSAPPHAAADIKIYLSLYRNSTTPIQGDVTAVGHENEIEVLSYNYGLANTPRTNLGGAGSVAGKVSFTDLTVKKKFDKASVPLYQATATGTHLTTGALTVAFVTDISVPLLRIDLSNILITSVQPVGVANPTDVPTETISLNFGKIHWTYYQQSPNGTLNPAFSGGWDLVLGVAIALVQPASPPLAPGVSSILAAMEARLGNPLADRQWLSAYDPRSRAFLTHKS